ncbi:MAG: hypothetical protein LUQ50_02160 [Methanospirillum sp.]|uniref:hypothetical protein n=1 Tax=Methanospirillum sp. TaxID=45200 RepID=UPI00236BCAC4|nr:hypothetical protein [Methanospirillum sp.]MDD1727857.1 hypothetical protein [Methanospirillum sp.]
MPDHLILFTSPVISGARSFYPLVRVSVFAFQNGQCLSGEPVALLIEEEGLWYFSSLTPGIAEDILLHVETR